MNCKNSGSWSEPDAVFAVHGIPFFAELSFQALKQDAIRFGSTFESKLQQATGNMGF
jgi:hypothetical protein